MFVCKCVSADCSVLPSTAQYCTPIPIPSPSFVSLTDTFLEPGWSSHFPDPSLQSTRVSGGSVSVCGPECYSYTDYNQFTSQWRYLMLWPGSRWLMPMSQTE